jgi:acyl carrier protein
MARSPDELLKLVAKVVHEVTGAPTKDVTVDKSFVDDLDVDSLAMVEVVVGLEEETGVSIPDKDAKALRTVGAVVNYLTKKGA